MIGFSYFNVEQDINGQLFKL